MAEHLKRFTERSDAHKFAFYGGILLVGTAGFMGLSATVINHFDSAAVYGRTYADDGECLDKGPYDPKDGASAIERTVKDDHVLTIVPSSIQDGSNADLLNFRVNSNFPHQPQLSAADYPTAALLAKQCGEDNGS